MICSYKKWGNKKSCYQDMHINVVDFLVQTSSLQLKNGLRKRNFSEINVLPCHMRGSAPIDPKFKIFVENINMCQSSMSPGVKGHGAK